MILIAAVNARADLRLVDAAANNDTATVRSLVSARAADVNGHSADGTTALESSPSSSAGG